MKKYRVDLNASTQVCKTNNKECLSECMHYLQDSNQPIHIAAFHGYSDIVRTLVEDYNINPNAKSYVSIV